MIEGGLIDLANHAEWLDAQVAEVSASPPPPLPPTLVAGHTGTDTMIWSQGPGSAALGRAIGNTTVYEVVKAVLRQRMVPRRPRAGVSC